MDRRSFFETLGAASVALGSSGRTAAAPGAAKPTRIPGTADAGESMTGRHFENTATEIANNVTPEDLRYPPGDLRRYGALGDDSSDNTEAFTRASDFNYSAYEHAGGRRETELRMKP